MNATTAIKTASRIVTVNVFGRGTDWYASVPNYSDRPEGPCVHSRATSRQGALRIVRTVRAELALHLMGKLGIDVAYAVRDAIDQAPMLTLAQLVKIGSDAFDLISE